MKKNHAEKHAAWVKKTEVQRAAQIRARKSKKSRYAPQSQDSQLFWQEAWKLKEALREAIRG